MSRMRVKLAETLFALAFCLSVPAIALAGGWIADAKTGCKVWNPHPSAGEAARWSGPCKDGFAEGKGVLDWLRGDSQYERDEGVWRAGRQTGEGTQIWPHGQYKGKLAESLPSGQGTLTLGERSYEGAFLEGKPDGSGTLTDASGKISGVWRGGCFNDGTRRAAIGVPLQTCP